MAKTNDLNFKHKENEIKQSEYKLDYLLRTADKKDIRRLFNTNTILI